MTYSTTALLTDRYEFTMLDSLVNEGMADQTAVFELFSRRLPEGRRFGMVAGTGRLLEGLAEFNLLPAADWAYSEGIITRETHRWMYDATSRDSLILAQPDGTLYHDNSPVMTFVGPLGLGILLETLALSIYNHDSAIASAAARMVIAANGRPIIEMGSRRTHEDAAVAVARSAYIAGFGSTSNLEAGRRWNIPTSGTAAHAFTLAHKTERDAFAAQIAALGVRTTLLVDTYDIEQGIRTAVEVAGPELGAIRIDSGDLDVESRRARRLLDELGATKTRITVTSDLDEYVMADLAAAPIDGYGAGTRVATGSGHPTAGMVYKLVEIEGRPVAKKSASKNSIGGRKYPWFNPDTREHGWSMTPQLPKAAQSLHEVLAEGGKLNKELGDLEIARATATHTLANLSDEDRKITNKISKEK